MTTQLGLYNQALLILGERRLTAIDSPATEKSQIELDVVWDNGAIDYCLEQALWNFAMRSIQLSYDPDTTPPFGLQFAFNKPTDWIRTAALCEDDHFYVPCLDYEDRADFWWSDLNELYIKYVSNDSAYGADLSLWPQSFIKFVAAYLAKEACSRIIVGDKEKRKEVEAIYRTALLDASAKDAINEATKFPAEGNWAASRRTGRHLYKRPGGYSR